MSLSGSNDHGCCWRLLTSTALPQRKFTRSAIVVAMRRATTSSTAVAGGSAPANHAVSTTSRTPRPAGAPGTTNPAIQLVVNAPLKKIGPGIAPPLPRAKDITPNTTPTSENQHKTNQQI